MQLSTATHAQPFKRKCMPLLLWLDFLVHWDPSYQSDPALRLLQRWLKEGKPTRCGGCDIFTLRDSPRALCISRTRVEDVNINLCLRFHFKAENDLFQCTVLKNSFIHDHQLLKQYSSIGSLASSAAACTFPLESFGRNLCQTIQGFHDSGHDCACVLCESGV